MLDTAQYYITRSGRRVTIHEIVLRNSCGEEVTFPVKGSVQENKPRAKSEYQIFTLEGAACVLGPHEDDIVGPWPTPTPNVTLED